MVIVYGALSLKPSHEFGQPHVTWKLACNDGFKALLWIISPKVVK